VVIWIDPMFVLDLLSYIVVIGINAVNN
jgi:hypothetical protein